MRVRRPWIKPSSPLIFPLLLVTALGVLTQVLSSLSVVDRTITRFVDILPASLTPAFSLIADAGTVPALIFVAIVVAAYELARRHYVRGSVMLGSLVSLVAFILLKETIRRARPVTEFVRHHGLHDFSFPSGHATGSAAVYGMVIVLILSGSKRPISRVAVGLLVVLILLIGVSRVFLGAHFPTDVLGGWLLALVIVSLLRSLTLAIAKRSPQPTAEALEDTTEAEPTN